MKIDAMVVRENFYEIFEKTMEKYYKTVSEKDVKVNTQKSKFKNGIVVYPHLGFVTTRKPHSKVFQYCLNEYNIRDRIMKNVLAKTYVVACFLSYGLLADNSIYLSDPTIFIDSIAIIPANRKIRIYNFKTGYVEAIIKDSFTTKYFNNELLFRLNNPYFFIPPITAYGNDWYREPILPGQALARVKDKNLYKRSVSDAIEYMKIIAANTIEYVNPTQYSISLFNQIVGKMKIAKATKKFNCFDLIIEIANRAVEKAILLDAELPVVDSHGDLQSGNVWVDIEAKRTYIIDWETHDKRSIWYDCATLLLSTRRKNKLKYMMEYCETESVRNAILMNDEFKDYDMKSVMGIITLEDISFYLEDMLELPGSFGGDIFDRIAGELDKMGWRTHYA